MFGVLHGYVLGPDSFTPHPGLQLCSNWSLLMTPLWWYSSMTRSKKNSIWPREVQVTTKTLQSKGAHHGPRRFGKITHLPLSSSMEEMERLTSSKFLRICLTEDLTWSLKTGNLDKRAQKYVFFSLQILKQAVLTTKLHQNYNRNTMKSTVWYATAPARIGGTSHRRTGLFRRLWELHSLISTVFLLSACREKSD